MSTTDDHAGTDGHDGDHPTPADGRDRFATRLREAGLSVARFIDVVDGEKGSRDHTQRQPDDSSLSGNYGIYAGVGDDDGEGGHLIDVDVDDYDDGVDDEALAVVDDLPATFTVTSPHTSTESPGHRYYRVDGDPIEVVRDVRDDDTLSNPTMSWGEIRIENQYTVGPGSQLDGCDKEWCDSCATAGGGYYRISEDRQIATISEEQLTEVLAADRSESSTPTRGDASEGEATGSGCSGESTDTSVVLKANPWIGSYLALGTDDDRSKKDFAVCQTLIESGVSEDDAHALLNDSPHTKVNDRGRSYWDSTWSSAWAKANLPGSGGGSGGSDGDPATPTGFVCRDGRYGYEVTSDGDDEPDFKPKTNFQLEARSFLIEDGGADVTVELTVHPATDEDEYDVTVPMGVFTEPRTFRQEVASGRTTVYDGGTKFLNKIRAFVGSQEAPIRTPTAHLGLHGWRGGEPEFILPDGTLTADGWSDEPGHVFTGPDSFDGKAGLTPDVDEFDREVVASILELLPQTRDPNRFLPILGWFYAAPLRPLIMAWEREFNLLAVTGSTGSGKTASLALLSECFGLTPEAFSATGTNFPKKMALASTNAIPVWFDEFKPADMADHKVDKLKHYLRLSTTGTPDQSGNADKTIDKYPLLAPAIISGEQILSGPAEERRSIQTTLRESTTDSGSETNRAHSKLTGSAFKDGSGGVEYYDGYDLRAHALAYYQWALTRAGDSGDLEDEWHDAGERVAAFLAQEDIDVHETVEQGFQTILFGCRLYRGFCEAMGANSDMAGVTDESALSAIDYVARDGRSGADRESHLDRLLGLAALAAYEGHLRMGDHYKIVSPRGGGNDELRLKLESSFNAIRKYAQEFNVKDADLLDSARDYKARLGDATDRDDTYVISSSVQTRELNRTCAIDIDRASESIEAFGRGMFTDDQITADHTGSQVVVQIVAESEPIQVRELRDAVMAEHGGSHDDANRAIRHAREKGTIYEARDGYRKNS